MTIVSLIIGTIVSQILFATTKVLFITSVNLDSGWMMTVFFVALAAEAIAISRRMGTLNYLEAFFLTAVWLILSLLVDLVITTNFTGRDVYTTLYFWMTYLVIALAVIIFHKKIHVEVRKTNTTNK